MREWPIEKDVLRKQPRLGLPGELRGAKAIAVFGLSTIALGLVTFGIAIWKAVR